MRNTFLAVLVLFWGSTTAFAQNGGDIQPVAAIDLQTGALTGASGHIVSTNTGTGPFDGLSINSHVGADRFYNEGYTGTRAVVANVEGGHVWNGHETLGHVSNFFDARQTYINNGFGFGSLGQADRHATWVAQVIGGRGPNEYQRGIAHGADLWSGAIATSYSGAPWSNSWGWSRGHAFTDAYALPTLSGVNGRTADVVNSSWGFLNTSSSTLGGNNIFSVTADGIAQQSRATFVFSAGNAGPGPNTVGAPANAYNNISVGALGSDTSNPAYGSLSTFSSRGPQTYSGPDGVFANARAPIDITAPGQNMTLAFYGGTTGGNVGGFDPSGGATNWYTFNAQGTSFAAPTVAGGAALLADVAYDRFAGNVANAKDGQVIKSVLLNSAAKPGSWNNGQQLVGNTIRTTQALDYNYGAGMLDLNQAFDQFTAGTTDVAGLGGGTVEEIGWDYGVVSQNGANEYIISDMLKMGTDFSATLNWFVGRSWNGNSTGGSISATDAYFTNLSLELWSLESGALDQLIAESNAAFINTEHFSFEIPETDNYALRVNWVGERYDFVGNSQQTYGLSWAGTAIPEPGTAGILMVAAATFVLRRRRS